MIRVWSDLEPWKRRVVVALATAVAFEAVVWLLVYVVTASILHRAQPPQSWPLGHGWLASAPHKWALVTAATVPAIVGGSVAGRKHDSSWIGFLATLPVAAVSWMAWAFGAMSFSWRWPGWFSLAVPVLGLVAAWAWRPRLRD